MSRPTKVGARRAKTHWAVIAVLENGSGSGTCGHEHPTADAATMCSWTPKPWPEVCDLLVRQVRTPERSWSGLPLWRAAEERAA